MNTKRIRTALAGALLSLALFAPPAAAARVYVQIDPPPVRVEVRGVAPSPRHVWCDGYWDLRGRNWAWAPGRWVRPPHQRAVWVSPYWEPHGRNYRFHRGHWCR